MSAPRPQTLMLTLLGRHVRHREDQAIASATFLAAMELLGISVDAARSTLARMVSRGYTTRHRHGRKAYFTLTARSERLLAEGEERIFRDPVGADTGEWTLLSFSIPEAMRSDRHSLRVALSWKGFGLLRSGFWTAPGRPDVTDILVELDLVDRVELVLGTPKPPTRPATMVREAWELEDVARGYEAFLDAWRNGRRDDLKTALARQIRLITEWRLLLVDDPHLPRRLLPTDCPAPVAYETFRRLHDELTADAERDFAAILDSISLADLAK